MTTENTAYHEAGHSVAWWLSGRAFRFVTIIPEGGAAGYVCKHQAGEWFRPDIEIDARTRRRIEDEIIMGWSGVLAEAIHAGTLDELTPGQVVGSEGDASRLARFALSACGEEDESAAFLEWLRLKALNRLLLPHAWAAVDALAAVLLDRGKVSWRDARGIMQQAAFPTTSA